MKKFMMPFHFLLAVAVVAGFTPLGAQDFQYPETRKTDVTDVYFGQTVADPYRWLEDDRSAETEAWVKAQNQITATFLENIPARQEIRRRLEEIWNYPRYSAPFKKGSRYYFYKNDGLQNQSVLYVQTALDAEPQILLDPNTLSPDGTVALSGTYFSEDGRYMGYAVSQAGSDWREFFVRDMETGAQLEDHIQWVKFSGMAWVDNGFYYTRFPKPDTDTQMTSPNENGKIYYHALGTSQSEDRLIFQDPEHPRIGNYLGVTEGGRFAILYRSLGTHGTAIKVLDRTDPNGRFQDLVTDFNDEYSVVDEDKGDLLILTTRGAPRQMLVRVDPNFPEPENWVTLIPESRNTLTDVSAVGGKLVARYMEDASTRLKIFSRTGIFEKEIQLPSIGSAGGFSGQRDQPETFYTFTSFTRPPTIYRYDFATGNSTVFRESEIQFNSQDYDTKQVFYPSRDGTRIPMFLVFRKGLQRDGTNPTLLYGYGGFNISLTPSFSVSNLVFLEQGGIYALANLRGGGEYGEEWHRAGMLASKQNVFDDFIAAAEYLIREKYTSADHLAIKGGSNGGLLIGATVNQRPDLFRVAIPQVGVMDMLRYHKFTIGHAWAVEYGSSDEEENFRNLIKFSPLHNVRGDVPYPAILVTTADHDDRVVPAHSFKYSATLQEKQSRFANPMLIRIETRAGHGAGKPTAKIIEEQADIWSFILYYTR